MNEYYLPRGTGLTSKASNSDGAEFSTLAILRGVLVRGVAGYCDVSPATTATPLMQPGERCLSSSSSDSATSNNRNYIQRNPEPERCHPPNALSSMDALKSTESHLSTLALPFAFVLRRDLWCRDVSPANDTSASLPVASSIKSINQRVNRSSWRVPPMPSYQSDPKRANYRCLGGHQARLRTAHVALEGNTFQALRPCPIPCIHSNALLGLACSVDIGSLC